MKQLRQCLNCKNPVPESLAYQAELEYWGENITGEPMKYSIKGWICPSCNKSAGYKTSKKKLERFAPKLVK